MFHRNYNGGARESVLEGVEKPLECLCKAMDGPVAYIYGSEIAPLKLWRLYRAEDAETHAIPRSPKGPIHVPGVWIHIILQQKGFFDQCRLDHSP